MFTKEELLREYKTLTLKPLMLMKVQRFRRNEYPFVAPESAYCVYRGRVEDFDSPMQFYCEAIVQWWAEDFDYEDWKTGWQGWVQLEVEAALCLPISKQEFPRQIYRAIGDIKHLVELPPLNDFVGALQMIDKWNRIAILAQYQQEFIYADWGTSG